MNKDILIFDIWGYAGHFRKFYTNSSSLTYSIPPRTTISGIVAAIMGRERDSYYDEFSADNVDIAIRKNIKTRKILQSVNYMKITTNKHFEFPENHTQIPYEMVLSVNDYLSYRIYISHKDKSFMDELEYRLKNRKYYYSPFLGAASFNCGIDYIAKTIATENEGDDMTYIVSPIPFNKIEDRGIVLSKIDTKNVMIVKERMPREFEGNRNIKAIEYYIFDENTNPIPVKLKGNCINVQYNGVDENILFM
ncbi:type I-B CRISPR-associated protein Cas5b [Clostridiisalibacter paucivorans]|uniref:type I-B CRISPR-associated protein Cas5b n=1 Tax=Clostridiisalibacter paucivorans TaxID=408753 RepID=UPI0005583EFD|nr:type I-B CRISPR-associated protein Cas5b [Clostridiisalibacter paucivorans]